MVATGALGLSTACEDTFGGSGSRKYCERSRCPHAEERQPGLDDSDLACVARDVFVCILGGTVSFVFRIVSSLDMQNSTSFRASKPVPLDEGVDWIAPWDEDASLGTSLLMSKRRDWAGGPFAFVPDSASSGVDASRARRAVPFWPCRCRIVLEVFGAVPQRENRLPCFIF